MMSFIDYQEHDHVGVLTISRPEALNALNSTVVAQLATTLEQIEDSSIRCLIITGAGEKSFVAGADIGEMKDLPPEQAAQFSLEGNKVMEQIEQLSIPVIAAVNGFALGGGCEVALSCDIRIAAENAQFAFPEVGIGILPGYGGVQRMARTVGLSKAKELAFTGNRIKAEEALRLGLVSAVVPLPELMSHAMAMAERIAANAPFAVRAVKTVANESIGLSLKESSRLEQQLFGQCFATQDQKEGMTAFLEKRKPEPFTGN